MSVGNNAQKFNDFDFVELHFTPVLRLPRPQENQFTTLGVEVNKLIFTRFKV
jgi:hypothetical protein